MSLDRLRLSHSNYVDLIHFRSISSSSAISASPTILSTMFELHGDQVEGETLFSFEPMADSGLSLQGKYPLLVNCFVLGLY